MRERRTPPASREAFERELIDLIAFGLSSRRRAAANLELKPDTPLFGSGLIDSLAILELIAWVEQATGQPVPARQVSMKHFGTIERISNSFWRDPRILADDDPRMG